MKLIALCGAPGSGKSEVQKFLKDTYGVASVDDGHPLRDFAMRHLGLSEWHVTTQDGKIQMVTLPGGKTMTVREALGQLGNRIEDLFGPDAIPDMAYRKVKAEWMKTGKLHTAYSLGSVRREQGAFYKKHGAVVMEITRPGFNVKNEFDRYDLSCVDFTIINDGSVKELQWKVGMTLGPWLRPHV